MNTENKSIEISNQGSEVKIKKRSPIAAAFFTLLVPGLGHFYCGEVKRGFILFLSYTFYTTLFLALIKLKPDYTITYFAVFTCIPLGIYILLESIIIAVKKKQYVLQFFNKPKYYVAIIITSLYYAGPVADFFHPESFKTPSGSMMNTILVGDTFLTNDLAYGIKNPFTGKYFIIYNKPGRGDIVNFIYHGMPGEAPPKEKTNYLKRIIGLPGDSLVINNGFIYLNSKIYDPPSTSILMGTFKYKPDLADPKIFPKGYKWNQDYYGPIYIPKESKSVNFDTSDIRLWSRIIEDEGNKLEIIKSRIFINDIEKYSYTFKNNYYFVLGDNWYNSLDSRYWGFVKEDDIVSKITMIIFSWDTEIPISDFSRRINSIRGERIGKMIE